MKQRTLWNMLGTIALAALVTACGKEEPAPAKGGAPKAAAEAPVVRIGLAAPLTGPQAHIGVDIRNGAQLAVDDLNAAGTEIDGKKVRFELVAEDDEANPT